jgi:hypothetical protein
MLRRIIALVIGAALLVGGLLQWAALWHYSASARGQVVALTYLDSSSNVLGLTFARRSAHMGVHFTTPDGTSYQFTYILARPAGAGQQDIQTSVPVALRYDPHGPQDAIAEVEYTAARTRGILTALAGVLVGGLGFFLFRKRAG